MKVPSPRAWVSPLFSFRPGVWRGIAIFCFLRFAMLLGLLCYFHSGFHHTSLDLLFNPLGQILYPEMELMSEELYWQLLAHFSQLMTDLLLSLSNGMETFLVTSGAMLLLERMRSGTLTVHPYPSVSLNTAPLKGVWPPPPAR